MVSRWHSKSIYILKRCENRYCDFQCQVAPENCFEVFYSKCTTMDLPIVKKTSKINKQHEKAPVSIMRQNT